MDIGLLRQLCRYLGEDSGQIYETMIVSEVVKWTKTMQKNTEIYFYRTRSGLDLDLLLQIQWGIIGAEIKARKKLASTDITPMKKISKGLGDLWKGGLVIYKGDEISKIGEPNIWAVPSYRLFI